jgi:hypothetical protein
MMTVTLNLEIVVAKQEAELIQLPLYLLKLCQVVIQFFKILKMKTTSFKALSHIKVNLKQSKIRFMMRYLSFMAKFTKEMRTSMILLKSRK